MKESINYIVLVMLSMLVACETETLDPRTNPRFSVALIQEVSTDGLQVGASIYDFGGEEILEYGFVYSENSASPNIKTDDFISKKGMPQSYFELLANHSLILGKKYYVAAFLRTSTNLVYSKSMDFVSQGSEGFIVNSVEWPEVIYRGQKLLVKGSRFSKQKSNYRIRMGAFEVYPDELDSNSFTINIPLGLLTQTTGQDVETELKIEIGEKIYSQKRLLKFKEPVFVSLPIQKISTDQEVVIQGDFLDLGTVNLKIGEKEITGLSASQNELRFFPFKNSGINPTQSEPDITFTIRGKSYPLGKVFGLKGPEIKGDKVVLNKNSQSIPAVNFNLGDIGDINFFDKEGKEVKLPITGLDASSIQVDALNGIYPSREFSMQLKSFGLSSNFVQVEVSNPVVQITASDRSYQYSRNNPALVSGGNAYVLTDTGVIKESLDGTFRQQKIVDLPFKDRWVSINQAVEGGFVYGGGINYSSEPQFDLYYFSPERSYWEKLPDLPQPFNSFETVTSKDGYLIFEKALKQTDEVHGERWKLNLLTKTWEKLPLDSKRFIVFQRFYDRGDSYFYGLEYSSENKAIYKMKDDFSWELHLEIPVNYETPDFTAPVVIGGNYYILSERRNTMVAIDLNLKSFRTYIFPYYSYQGAVPVVRSEGIVILSNSDYHLDIRPELF